MKTPAIPRLLLAVACSGIVSPLWAKEPCPLVPEPKSYRDHGQSWTLKHNNQAAIVIGRQATEPERYAAERLQTHIERRFKQRVPILTETAVPETVLQLFLLGQPATNDWVARLYQSNKTNLGPSAPGEDGFVIEMLQDGPRQVALVGGSNARGVIYGQDALFDLMRGEKGGIRIPVVSVRDWPSIAWRGRPHSVLHHHLVPGALDAYVRSRINFTDVRDNPDVKASGLYPARKASMGFPAGKPIDREPVKRVIDESHRRGMFVYGTVSCGVEESRFPAVIQTFKELIELGVDGLWISFDDTGAGTDAPEIIRQVLELGRRHGMTDRKIAITPPDGPYKYIDRDFNRIGAAVPGMTEAQWFFTRVPCQVDVEMARKQGIQRLPGWWHNLVGIRGGFLHNSDVVCTLRADDRPAYLDMQPLARGWHSPDYEQLREAEKFTDCVLLWAVCNGWPEEYEVGALGLWAWNPGAHDWQQVRRSVYGYVYGPNQLETAMSFDDKLGELKSLFILPAHRFEPNKGFPGRLKKSSDRERALALTAELKSLADTLTSHAPAETALDPARLESVYLEPMRTTLVFARKMAMLDYPEDSFPDLEERMVRLLEAGDRQGAKQALDQTRPQVERQLARIASELQGLKGIDGYLDFWRQRISGIETWQTLVNQRRAKMPSRLKDLFKAGPTGLFPYKQATEKDLEALFLALDKVPAGKPLVEVRAEDWLVKPAGFGGLYAVGPYDYHGSRLVAIAYPPNVASKPGDYGEVTAGVQVPPHQGRLVLEAFVNDTRLDNRWRGYRFLQLWAGDRLVWEEDIARDRTGREWVRVELPPAIKPGGRLELRFRVVEKRAVSSHTSVAFLGPVRLRSESQSK